MPVTFISHLVAPFSSAPEHSGLRVEHSSLKPALRDQGDPPGSPSLPLSTGRGEVPRLGPEMSHRVALWDPSEGQTPRNVVIASVCPLFSGKFGEFAFGAVREGHVHVDSMSIFYLFIQGILE